MDRFKHGAHWDVGKTFHSKSFLIYEINYKGTDYTAVQLNEDVINIRD